MDTLGQQVNITVQNDYKEKDHGEPAKTSLRSLSFFTRNKIK
jgi:hypothetical protein